MSKDTSRQALGDIHARFTTHFATAVVPVIGVDFTSAPRRAKPIVVARGCLTGARHDAPRVRIDAIERLDSLAIFGALLVAPGPWVGGFDLPFGLPREFVLHSGYADCWRTSMQRYAACSRETLRERFKAFCAQRPVGGKFAHRATDRPAGSSPSMKWVNPPVAWMMHAGVPCLMAAGVTIPGMQAGDASRIALEAYPGLLARSITKASYKSDTRALQTSARQRERERIIAAVEAGRSVPGLPTELNDADRSDMLTDASGDALDAVLCLVQAAWGFAQRDRCMGLMPGFDALEGWIVGAGTAVATVSR